MLSENRIKQIQFEKQLEYNPHNWKSMFNQAKVKQIHLTSSSKYNMTLNVNKNDDFQSKLWSNQFVL